MQGHTPIDISSEEYRYYTYPNGTEVHIQEPKDLYVIVDNKGTTHRVVDINGITHRPERGWVMISWKSKEGKPPFIA